MIHHYYINDALAFDHPTIDDMIFNEERGLAQPARYKDILLDIVDLFVVRSPAGPQTARLGTVLKSRAENKVVLFRRRKL